MLTFFSIFGMVLILVLMMRFRASAIIASTFILFVLLTRSFSLAYIEFFGPMYAEQLYTDIGGTQFALPVFLLGVSAFLGPLIIIFRTGKLSRSLSGPLAARRVSLYVCEVVFYFSLFFILILYVDMLRRGVFPLFENMERFDYAKLHAGPFHHILFEHGFLLASLMGASFTYPRLVGLSYKYKFIVLLLLVYIYFILTGNRFSVFFSFTSFFILPLSAVFLLKDLSILSPMPRTRSLFKKILACKAVWHAAIMAIIFMLFALILNSVINVRKYDDPKEKLIQRVLIQPAELWWVTWNRVVRNGDWTPNLAWDLMFENPIDPDRNTGMQYLMVKSLGFDRAEELLSMGSQYAGGYPETLFEFLGPYAALPVAFLFGIITALLLRIIVVAVCRGNFGTVFMGAYLYYGFSLLYVGGMLNFLATPTFYLKLIIFLMVFLIEGRIYHQRCQRHIAWLSNNSYRMDARHG